MCYHSVEQTDKERVASLVVQCLRLCVSNAGGQGSTLVRKLISHATTESLHATTKIKDPACFN